MDYSEFLTVANDEKLHLFYVPKRLHLGVVEIKEAKKGALSFVYGNKHCDYSQCFFKLKDALEYRLSCVREKLRKQRQEQAELARKIADFSAIEKDLDASIVQIYRAEYEANNGLQTQVE